MLFKKAKQRIDWKRCLAITVLLIALDLSGPGSHLVLAAPPSDSLCSSGACLNVALSQPAWFDPQLETSASTPVQNGPGDGFKAYGDLPAGTASRVIAISKDGSWLSIALPAAIAADGMGWVNRSTVSTNNIEKTPDWLLHCETGTYCAYIISHSPQYLPVR